MDGAALWQTYWGVLAPSPREFGECGDIEIVVDPMHNNECAMMGKGLRVTPVPGGEAGGDRGQLRGCDVYTRVQPDRLSTAQRSVIEDQYPEGG
ncbi:hypothetical protein VTI74DRAFT_10000 [Chaetomium olivicolor]